MPEVESGRILGHEAVGTVLEVGAAVTGISEGSRVLISCFSGCGRCRFCRTGSYGQCLDAGGLVDTYSTPTLMSMLAAGQLDTASYITHHFSMDQMIQAYNVSSRASATGALKVALTRS